MPSARIPRSLNFFVAIAGVVLTATSLAGAADNSSIANTKVRLTSPDGRGCGMFGCVQNDDGSYSPRRAPGAGSSSASDSDSDSGSKGPREIVPDLDGESLKAPDPRVCGVFGCTQMPDGTFRKNVSRPAAKPTNASKSSEQANGCSYAGSGGRVIDVNGKPTCAAFMRCSGVAGPGLCAVDKGGGCPTSATECANDETVSPGPKTKSTDDIYKGLCMDPKTFGPVAGCKPEGKAGNLNALKESGSESGKGAGKAE